MACVISRTRMHLLMLDLAHSFLPLHFYALLRATLVDRGVKFGQNNDPVSLGWAGTGLDRGDAQPFWGPPGKLRGGARVLRTGRKDIVAFWARPNCFSKDSGLEHLE
eukprot:1150749-Pelagomonas_calceolata.AAC.1